MCWYIFSAQEHFIAALWNQVHNIYDSGIDSLDLVRALKKLGYVIAVTVDLKGYEEALSLEWGISSVGNQ